MKIDIDGIPVTVKNSRGKSVRIKVDARGQVTAFLPCGVSEDYLVRFIRSKLDWVRNALIKVERANAVEAGCIKLFGKHYRVVPIASGKSHIASGVLYLKAARAGEEAAKKAFQKKCLQAYLDEKVPFFSQKTGLYPSSYAIRDMKSRYGSCLIARKKIHFSLVLATKPVECIDYVIVHELCHLREANHGVRFKQLMSCYMPDWKQRKNLLNGE